MSLLQLFYSFFQVELICFCSVILSMESIIRGARNVMGKPASSVGVIIIIGFSEGKHFSYLEHRRS